MPHLGYFEDKEAPNSGRPDFGIYVSDRESGPGPESTLVFGSGPDQRYQEYPHHGLVRGKAALMRPHGGVASEGSTRVQCGCCVAEEARELPARDSGARSAVKDALGGTSRFKGVSRNKSVKFKQLALDRAKERAGGRGEGRL